MKENIRPPAIVLSRTITGLATIRSLSKAGIDVHAFYFDKSQSVRFSRYCKKIYFNEATEGEAALLDAIISYAKKLGNRPVIFANCDAHVLLLAKNEALLRPVCRLWKNDYGELINLINKNKLYLQSTEAGIDVIPSITEPTLENLTDWSDKNPAPYLVKPFYEGIDSSRISEKNLRLSTRGELLSFMSSGTSSALIVQRLLRGGDGFIFDCCGVSDTNGHVVTMASRRRWRQSEPDFGTGTYAEVPCNFGNNIEVALFDGTERLLKKAQYHGIFMIEWLYERETSKLYIIDFNARPFMSIGQFTAAGLNLPALAYSELVGSLNQNIEKTPKIQHLFAVDMLRDLESYLVKRSKYQITFIEWFLTIIRCRHFYYTDWHDPLPAIHRAFVIILRITRFSRKKIVAELSLSR